MSILNSTKSTDISNIVKSLSPDAQDTLMKYIYKGMALPGWGDVSGSVLLGWHEKVCSLFIPCMSSMSQTNITVDGGCGHRMYCAGDDGQEDCMNTGQGLYDI